MHIVLHMCGTVWICCAIVLSIALNKAKHSSLLQCFLFRFAYIFMLNAHTHATTTHTYSIHATPHTNFFIMHTFHVHRAFCLRTNSNYCYRVHVCVPSSFAVPTFLLAIHSANLLPSSKLFFVVVVAIICCIAICNVHCSSHTYGWPHSAFQ